MTPLASQRLILVPLSPEVLAALMREDREAAEQALDATFPPSGLVPPLMSDVLEYFLDLASAGPASRQWSARAYITVDSRDVVGMGGFGGAPDEHGLVTMGYSVFPEHRRRGYASEAARALTDWALSQDGVHGVRATISPRNVASERVAAAAGLQPTGAMEEDQDEGPVVVWERTQDTQ